MEFNPFVSVIVPTYNRAKNLHLCLDALLKIDYGVENFQIIIINDGSKDHTEKILRKYKKENPNFIFFTQKNSGPAKARNLGIKKTKGEIILFIDDDVVVQKDIIRRHVKHYRNIQIGGVGGQIFPKKLSWPDKYYLARYLEEIYTEMKITDPESGQGLATANCSYRTKILKKIGGFNENFPLAAGEDIELSKRVIQEGSILEKDPQIIAEHLRSETFKSCIRLKFKRMSSVVVEEKMGTRAKNIGNPYSPKRVFLQWQNFKKLKIKILKEEIVVSDYLKFFYLTIALFLSAIFGKIYFKFKLNKK